MATLANIHVRTFWKRIVQTKSVIHISSNSGLVFPQAWYKSNPNQVHFKWNCFWMWRRVGTVHCCQETQQQKQGMGYSSYGTLHLVGFCHGCSNLSCLVRLTHDEISRPHRHSHCQASLFGSSLFCSPLFTNVALESMDVGREISWICFGEYASASSKDGSGKLVYLGSSSDCESRLCASKVSSFVLQCCRCGMEYLLELYHTRSRMIEALTSLYRHSRWGGKLFKNLVSIRILYNGLWGSIILQQHDVREVRKTSP